MLINDPPIPDPNDPSKLDEKMFKGRAMTYYGRWTYKYEIAAQKGAAAAVIIHETEPAAYPYSVVRHELVEGKFRARRAGQERGRGSGAFLDHARCRKEIARRLRPGFRALKKAAITKISVRSRSAAKANFEIKQQVRSFKSHNVIGKLDGSDPKLKDEYVIFSAHWDHLGRHPELQGDQIFNGAVDNASGVAAVITLGRAFTKLNPPPKRTLLFLARRRRKRACSAQNIMPSIRFIRSRKRWPISTSTA